ncbi:MAG TPA: hypothetical protein VOA64_20875 [Candidatus Dormibacteraeota bacterium]|nr:hypothetical protein [Candidatus Dormibacteraeota bacterium]
MTEAKPITILGLPKPFRGHIGTIQRNAITSWTMLRPRPEIYLFGEEEGVSEIAVALKINHLNDIARNEFGTPLLDDLLRRAREFANTPLLCYVNSDTILLPEFLDAVVRIHKEFPKFLGVSHRLNVDLQESLNFAADGESKLRLKIMPLGELGNPTAIDVFVFPPDLYEQVPPLALGRAWFDQWLIKDARRRGIPVVDVTRVARAIHQNHEYGHIAGGQHGAYRGEEAQHNLEIYGGVPHAFTLLDVTHELLPDGRIRRVHFRRQRAAVQEWIWKTCIQPTAVLRARLGLQRKRWRR